LFEEAVAADPGCAAAHMNLGIVLHGRGEAAAAEACHIRAVRLDPALPHAHYNLGIARLALGDVPGAESALREALRLRHDFPEAWVAMAEVLESAGRDGEALDALDSAIALRVDYAGALFNAGLLLRRLGRLDEAEARLRGVPKGHPDYANAMTALAATLRDQGKVEDAVAVMRAVVERLPDSGSAQSEFLFTLGFSDRVSAEALFAEHLWAGCRAEAETKPWRADFPNRVDPDRILNVGYLSGDFRGHSVAVFTELLFERHRRDRIRVHAYSSTPEHDPITARFMAGSDVWRDLRGQTDAAAAKVILGDEVDILVDLSGHTTPMRIGVLAGRAAPVQMTWLGYINTTGLTRVDYRITDPWADPPGLSESLHTERLLRMPHSQWCFRPPQVARGIPATRDPGLGPFTFGSFNQYAKVSESSVALWIGALRAAPATRLRVVGVPRGSATEALIGGLTRSGIDRGRYDLVERVPLAAYYAEFSRVDACLDTTPYSGGTTTCDALWMGVPVVTLAGERSMSRSTASLLTTAGLQELIARTPDEFAQACARLSLQGARTTPDREALRSAFAASPLMDEQSFTESLEDLYRHAWREWCGARR
jgi:predicted O-linked N-acetylglucosamine transferase (SPINDLY family)